EIARFRGDPWGGSYINGRLVLGGNAGVSGEPLEVQGPVSGIAHRDRDGVSPRWVNYAHGGYMSFYNDAYGDRLSISKEGHLYTTGNLQLPAAGTIGSPGRMHISGGELLWLLNTSGVVIGKEWGGNGNLVVEGNLSVQGVKNFIMPHPTDDKKEIAFVSLEGPE